MYTTTEWCSGPWALVSLPGQAGDSQPPGGPGPSPKVVDTSSWPTHAPHQD